MLSLTGYCCLAANLSYMLALAACSTLSCCVIDQEMMWLEQSRHFCSFLQELNLMPKSLHLIMNWLLWFDLDYTWFLFVFWLFMCWCHCCSWILCVAKTAKGPALYFILLQFEQDMVWWCERVPSWTGEKMKIISWLLPHSSSSPVQQQLICKSSSSLKHTHTLVIDGLVQYRHSGSRCIQDVASCGATQTKTVSLLLRCRWNSVKPPVDHMSCFVWSLQFFVKAQFRPSSGPAWPVIRTNPAQTLKQPFSTNNIITSTHQSIT